MGGAIMLTFLTIIVLLLILMSAGAPPLPFAAILAGVLFVAFWVLVLKLLIGFGHWLINEPKPRPIGGATPQHPRAAVRQGNVPRLCADPRCGQVNLAEARFCARCGQPLGCAPGHSGCGQADGRAA